jgi:uncharacterized protein (TIGR03032 family)
MDSANAHKENEHANFTSVFSEVCPVVLNELASSLFISTYQAGRLIIVRAEPEGGINTHFIVIDKPMGMAIQNNRFSLGSKKSIIEYHNVPASAPKVSPENTHDACFIQRVQHITGDVDIHEMAYDKNNELWFVNTVFSCLCTRTIDYSFEPRWRPKFISGFAPQDRCHLNGLAMVKGKPKYVSALGTANTPGSWRDEKASGGVIIDIDTDEIVSSHISMPHSPRFYNNQLWVLESGLGSLSRVDIQTGQRDIVCKLPGFTRGLDFIGNVAFVGLSEIRETATFGGLPITKEIKEPLCGVWMVNIDSGNIIGFLRFNGAVQEIFSVLGVKNTRFPMVLDTNEQLVDTSYVLSDEALKEVDFASMEKVAETCD